MSNKKKKCAYIKIDEFDYSIFKNGKNTGIVVTSYCSGCEPILFGNSPELNQLAHVDGCLSKDYYDDGRYYLYSDEEGFEE